MYLNLVLYQFKNVFFKYFLLSSLIPASGGVFGPQGESGSEPEDDGQMKFYTEQHRGRRRSKGTSFQWLQVSDLYLVALLSLNTLLLLLLPSSVL